MEELIKVKIEKDRQLVSARDLYKGLKISQRFSRWVENNFYFFKEGEDFYKCTSSTVVNNGARRELDDYLIVLDMAKQLAMMVRSKEGQQYREYFLILEKKWNSPTEVIKRGYQLLYNENIELKIEVKKSQEQLAIMKPKADFADAVTKSDGDVLVRELAKILVQNGITTIEVGGATKKMGERSLYQWLRENKYLCSKKGKDYNTPMSRVADKGWFRLVIRHIDNDKSGTTTYVTIQGIRYFLDKFMKLKAEKMAKEVVKKLAM